MANMHGELRDALNEVCLTESVCGACKEKKCLVGYSKYINAKGLNYHPPHIPNASEGRPINDMRGGYDDDNVLRTIAKTLVYCKTCKDNHTDDCVLAVIRNDMELIAFGEEIKYKGNPLSHMVDVAVTDESKGSTLAELYNVEKNIVRD